MTSFHLSLRIMASRLNCGNCCVYWCFVSFCFSAFHGICTRKKGTTPHYFVILCVSCPVHPFAFERPKPMALVLHCLLNAQNPLDTVFDILIKIMTDHQCRLHGSMQSAQDIGQCRTDFVFDFCAAFSCIAKYKTLYSIHCF